jgi:hypothetical protein
VATPGTAVRAAASWKTFWRPRASRTSSRSSPTGACAFPEAIRVAGLAQERPELALERPHAGLAGVLGHDGPQQVVGGRDLLLQQAVALALAGEQVVPRDRDLLLDGVAVEADDLHAVQQRAGNGLGLVGGGDEHDLREVELHVEVVVAERRVLRRVEHLEQGRARVPAPVRADLVDLVEEDDRVHRPRVAQGAHQAARERADVRAAVAADLGLVTDAAERHAHELAAHGAGDRLADGGLAGAGGPDQREDGARLLVGRHLAVLAQLLDCDVLLDAVLDVLQAGVVGVEHLAGAHGIELVLGALAPRHADEPVQVGPDHLALAALARALEPPELALGLLAHLVGHAGLVDLRAVLVDERGVVLAELLADRLHLLAQEVVALLLLGARLDVVADLAAHLQLHQPLALHAQGLLEALGDVERAEQLHLLLEGEVRGVAAGVGQRAGLGDGAHERGHAAVVAAELEELLDHGAVLALELAGAPVDRRRVGVLGDVDDQAAAQVGLGRADDAAGDALQRGAAGAARQADGLRDADDGADRRVLAVVAGDEDDPLLVADVDGKGDVHRREDDGVVERDEEEGCHGGVLGRLQRLKSWSVSGDLSRPD